VDQDTIKYILENLSAPFVSAYMYIVLQNVTIFKKRSLMKTSKNKKLTAFPETLSKGTEAQEFMAVFLFFVDQIYAVIMTRKEKNCENFNIAASLYFQKSLFCSRIFSNI